jgi:hypothetical protein
VLAEITVEAGQVMIHQRLKRHVARELFRLLEHPTTAT